MWPISLQLVHFCFAYNQKSLETPYPLFHAPVYMSAMREARLSATQRLFDITHMSKGPWAYSVLELELKAT